MKTVTIKLSIPKDLLNQAVKLAKRELRSRSELMRAVLRVYLERRADWDRFFAYADAHTKKMGLKPEDVEEVIREARRT